MKGERLRVLYVTNNFPYRLGTGLLRHHFLVKELSRTHRITLLSVVGAGFDPQDGQELAPFTADIHVVRRAASRAGRGVARVRTLLPGARSGTPTDRLRRVGELLTARQRFDVVFFSGKGNVHALPGFASCPVVADICDTASSRLLGNLRFAQARHIPRILFELAEMRRAERYAAARADHLVFASARDRDLLLERASDLVRRTPATVLPNGVDLEFWRREQSRLGSHRVVFHGSMDWPPNEDAALHLARDVMPLLWRSHPQAKLALVGHGVTPALRSAAVDPRITLTDWVPDVRPYLEQASTFAAPIRFASGIQNKVLEAMAMEVPAVVSPSAADGVRDVEGRMAPVVVASGAEAFAAALADRLDTTERDPTPDHAARRYVEQAFSWGRSGELLAQILEETATRPQARAVGAVQRQETPVCRP